MRTLSWIVPIATIRDTIFPAIASAVTNRTITPPEIPITKLAASPLTVKPVMGLVQTVGKILHSITILLGLCKVLTKIWTVTHVMIKDTISPQIATSVMNRIITLPTILITKQLDSLPTVNPAIFHPIHLGSKPYLTTNSL